MKKFNLENKHTNEIKEFTISTFLTELISNLKDKKIKRKYFTYFNEKLTIIIKKERYNTDYFTLTLFSQNKINDKWLFEKITYIENLHKIEEVEEKLKILLENLFNNKDIALLLEDYSLLCFINNKYQREVYYLNNK